MKYRGRSPTWRRPHVGSAFPATTELRFDEKSHSLLAVLMLARYYVAWYAVCVSWLIWRAYMAVKPVHAPPLVELRRRGRRRRLNRQLRTAVMVIAAIVIPIVALLYFGLMP